MTGAADTRTRTRRDPTFPLLLAGAGMAMLMYAATVYKAPEIEADVRERTRAAVAEAVDRPLDVEVNGRWVSVSGFVTGGAEATAALDAADAVWGALGPEDQLVERILADPYRLVAEMSRDGAVTVRGVAPNEAARDAIIAAATGLADENGGAATTEIDLALGEPNDAWANAVAVGLSALGRLNEGAATLEGDVVSVAGRTDDADVLAKLAEDREAARQLDYGWDQEIDAVARFAARKSADGAWEIRGDVETEESRDALERLVARIVGGAADVEVRTGVAEPPLGWIDAVANGLQALVVLDEGEVEIIDQSAVVDAIAATRPVFDEVIELTADVGEIAWRRQVALLYPDPPTGVAPELAVDISPENGVALRGALPDGLDGPDAAALLRLAAYEGAVSSSTTGDLGVWRADLATLGDFLSEFERAEIRFDADRLEIAGEVHRASDPAQVTGALMEAFGDAREVALSIDATGVDHPDGAERVNPTTGAREVFRRGFWMPAIEVDGRDDCARRSDLVLLNDRIRFLTDSTDLDVRARRALNELAAIAAACFRGSPLLLEIGGHTDSVGDAEYNLDLSHRRARAVAQALADRGVDATRLEAFGYGETLPIAENDTDEGRAANRRITFEWFSR